MKTIGKPLTRVDGRLKVTGSARYSAEWDLPGLVYGAVVTSEIARGKISSIDFTEAEKLRGVLHVVTHENAPKLKPLPEKFDGSQITGEGGLSEGRQPLQDTNIEYAGQVIAVVVADTLARALDAASRVKVKYDVEKPEFSLTHAERQTFPAAFAGNPKEQLQVTIGDPTKALAEAPVRLDLTYESPITHHHPMETIATIAQWDKHDGKDTLTLYDSTRSIENTQGLVALSFDLPRENVQVVCPFVGGAFGAKGWTYFNPILAAQVAKVAGKPVKIESRRQEMFSNAGHRPAAIQTFKLGATNDGKLTAFQHDTQTHTSMVSNFVEPCARMTRMMYAVPNLGFTHRLAHLNLPSPCPKRGPGDLLSSWALESALDELSVRLGIDPVELRLINHADKDPESGKPFSSKNLRQCYARGMEMIGWKDRKSEPRSIQQGNSLIGYGMATTMYPAGRRKASAKATIFADGSARVQSATHELGNGAYTIFRQISAEGFSLPVEKVRFELGDSAFPFAPTSGGSVTTSTVGPAALQAARAAIKTLIAIATDDESSPLFKAKEETITAQDGRLILTEKPETGEDYAAILRRAKLPEISAESEAAPEGESKFSSYSFGAIFAKVRVDETGGTIRVEKICAVVDAGTIMNPLTARSQISGGMMMALGETLMEETLYDPSNGRAVTRNLADYHFPSCADSPDMEIEFLDIPDPHMGELGARGVGELGCVGTPSAIANAVFNATGRRLRSLPLTPDKMFV